MNVPHVNFQVPFYYKGLFTDLTHKPFVVLVSSIDMIQKILLDLKCFATSVIITCDYVSLRMTVLGVPLKIIFMFEWLATSFVVAFNHISPLMKVFDVLPKIRRAWKCLSASLKVAFDFSLLMIRFDVCLKRPVVCKCLATSFVVAIYNRGHLMT